MNKTNQLFERLNAGWVFAKVLQSDFGWQPHTLRSAISTLAKTRKVIIARRRLNGDAQYKIVQPEELAQVEILGPAEVTA